MGSRSPDSEKRVTLGSYMGGYRLTGRLSSNALYYTFLGETESRIDRQLVVIKWFHGIHLHTQKAKKEFLHEAGQFRHLNHPSLLPFLSTGIYIDTPYIVTPYLTSGSLYDRLHNQQDRLWLQENALTIVIQIGEALHYLHRHAISHGHLHPHNILFQDNKVQLTDIHLASLSLPHIVTAHTGNEASYDSFDEKYAYYPGQPSPLNDQYALAYITYELLTGWKPFSMPTFQSTNSQQSTRKGSQHTRYIALAPYLEESLRRALSHNPAQRYNDIRAFLHALDAPTMILPPIPVSTYDATAPIPTFTITTYQPPFTPLLPLAPSTLPEPPYYRPSARSTDALSGSVALPEQAEPQSVYRHSRWSLFLLTGVLCLLLISMIGMQYFTHIPFSHKYHTTDSSTSQSPFTSPVISPTAHFSTFTPKTSSIQSTTQSSVSSPSPTASTTGTTTNSSINRHPLTVSPTQITPRNCAFKQNNYFCVVVLTLSETATNDEFWYIYADGIVAFSSPASSTLTRGSQMEITLQIASDCPAKGTIIFVGTYSDASLTWTC